jgi:hypothetical protein
MVAFAATSCVGQRAEQPVPTCEIRFAAPTGFAPLPSFEERYGDHVGLRLGFRDAVRRELHVFSGIPGEIGEGLPGAGELELSNGQTGVVLGQDTVWVLRWDEGDGCDPRAVLASGFRRKAFERVLVQAGIVPDRPG